MISNQAIPTAAGIRAGQVAINSIPLVTAETPTSCPWVGAKGSGFGYSCGINGWQQFSAPKSVIGVAKVSAGGKRAEASAEAEGDDAAKRRRVEMQAEGGM